MFITPRCVFGHLTSQQEGMQFECLRLKVIIFFKEIIANIISTNIVMVYTYCPLEHINLGVTKAKKTVDRYLVMVHNRKLIEN